MKILVALNSKAHFKLYDFAFSKIGFHILDIVDNGAEAISKYVSHQNEIEMMFIDGQMPDMTGMEAAAKILKEDPNANIVVLTEKSSDFVEDVYPLHTGKLSIKPFDLKKRFNKMPNQ